MPLSPVACNDEYRYLQPTFCLEGTYMLVYGEVAEEVYFISNGTVRQVNRWCVLSCWLRMGCASHVGCQRVMYVCWQHRGFCTGQLDTGSFFGEGGVLDHETATSSVRGRL